MRFKLISIIFAVILLQACTNQIQTTDNKIIKTISPNEFKEKLDTNEYILIDIRTKPEYDKSHLDNATLIDYYGNDFESQLNKLDKSKKYLIYCRSGSRTSLALDIFEELEFIEVYDLGGGIIAY